MPRVGAWRIDEPLEKWRPGAEPGPPLPLLVACLTEGRSPDQGLTRISPAVGVGVLRVVIIEVGAQAVLEFCRRSEVAALEETAREDAEPQLHLVEPRPV